MISLRGNNIFSA